MTIVLFTAALAAGFFVSRKLTRLDIAAMADDPEWRGCRWYTPEQWRAICARRSK